MDAAISSDDELTVWETFVEAEAIIVRDFDTKEEIAVIPNAGERGQALARRIAACGLVLKALKELLNDGEDEKVRERARLAIMVATGRAE